MGTNDSETLNQQRQRRKRINRMKTTIVMTIAIWMVVSFIAIIVLVYQVVRLNIRVNQLETMISSEMVSGNDTSDLENMPPDSTEVQGDYVFSNVITGIDSADNVAEEGDTHQVYLTFDGGPDENTNAVLDVLAQYQVKATFFVVGDDSEEMKAVYQRIVNEGHTLGMHSYSNQYSTVYASREAFTADFEQLQDYLTEVTGYESTYYRFPGGSSNQISNVNMAEFVQILNQEQVTYFDWNVSAGDASADYTAEDVVNNVIQGVSQYKTSVVLLHDGENKTTTAEALGPLIEALQTMNCEILPIDENTKVIQYIKAESVE